MMEETSIKLSELLNSESPYSALIIQILVEVPSGSPGPIR